MQASLSVILFESANRPFAASRGLSKRISPAPPAPRLKTATRDAYWKDREGTDLHVPLMSAERCRRLSQKVPWSRPQNERHDETCSGGLTLLTQLLCDSAIPASLN